MSVVRILLVDDNELWRQYISTILGQKTSFEVISEVSDGLQAIKIAEEQKPNIVLLDIGLPGQNGLEVGKRIRELVPECKLLFLSAECDPDVARAALQIGAMGYIPKFAAGRDLLAGIRSVLRGERFVSGGWLTSE
jgi:two-component system response regulator DegU